MSLNWNEFKKLVNDKLVPPGKIITISEGQKQLKMLVQQHPEITNKGTIHLPADILEKSPGKVIAIFASKLGRNKTVFARNCEVKKIEKKTAEKFLDTYHLMNSTSSAYNYGLFLKEELLAVASFSKGRKMDRLPDYKRSFELIRFCCREGITVTGGLTRLVKNFCREKNAGDIMTYVDKQFSPGESFAKAGFVKHGETEPKFFLVNKKTLERIPAKSGNEDFDAAKFYLVSNEGNIKFVYTPNDGL